jgi:hypothetical protein
LLLGSIAIHWNLNTFFMYLLFIFTNITTITAVTSGRLWWLRCSWFSWSSKGERTGKHNCIADSCTVVQILQLKIYSVLFISVTAVEVGREGLYCAGRRCHAFHSMYDPDSSKKLCYTEFCTRQNNFFPRIRDLIVNDDYCCYFLCPSALF